jgi:transposase-like protein
MTQPDQSKLFQLAMEQLIEHGPEAFRDVMSALMNEAMRIEREHFLGARQHERTDSRLGYTNGFKPKLLDSQLGTLHLRVPKTRDHGDTPFYPHSLEQGRRSERALMLCVAEMYINGVSTRRVEDILKLFGIEQISSDPGFSGHCASGRCTSGLAGAVTGPGGLPGPGCPL